VDEITSNFEKKLDENRHTRIQQEDERTELEKELFETQNQLEDDIDTEIEHLKNLYDEKLASNRETTLKYKGFVYYLVYYDYLLLLFLLILLY
jgi:hypothetical protein